MPKLGFTSVTLSDEDLQLVDETARLILADAPSVIDDMSPAEKIRLVTKKMKEKISVS